MTAFAVTAGTSETSADTEQANNQSSSKQAWNRGKDRNEEEPRHCLPRLHRCCHWTRHNAFILMVSILIFGVLLGSGVAISSVYMNSRESELHDAALSLAMDTGAFFADQLDQAILPLFSLAQFAVELPIFQHLPGSIGLVGEPGSLPLLPPSDPGGPYTHRNVTGVCDSPPLMRRFSGIASSIKKHAKMEGVLVNLQLAPDAVVCLLHPLNNTEDFPEGIFMDNTGARGLDLLTDPVSSFIAKAGIAQDDVIIAGPLTLRQCRDVTCDATVEKAFIARLPIAFPHNNITVNGVSYKKWGFATALINWEALVKRSEIFDTFKARGMSFKLTRTDKVFDKEKGQYTEKVVVLAETPGFDQLFHGSDNFVSTALQTTNNEWVILVIYDQASLDSSRAWIMFAVFLLSSCISALAFMVLHQRQIQQHMFGLTLAQEAKVETERKMTAYFAHELRNPLGAIDSAILSMPDDLPESAKELIAGMALCSSFMSSIMNNLLDVRKMEEGKMAFHLQPMSLSELTIMVHKMLLPSVSKGVEFTHRCETQGKDWVMGDMHRLQQVMTNTVTNAIKYTVSGSITLKMSWEGDFVQFECIDTGPGIPKDQQEKIFERFVQRGGAPGSGLGLAISRHIIDLMNGSIKFQSDPTTRPGTNCIVRIPLQICEPPKAKLYDDISPLDDEISILLIDDVKINKVMLGRRIKKSIAPNAIITEASTGEEALEICKGAKFDVIIVDQYMEEAGGKMLGTDCVMAMRQRELIDSIIVGSSGNEMDAEFIQAGADWVWQKPIPPNKEILLKLRPALQERRNRHATNFPTVVVPLDRA